MNTKGCTGLALVAITAAGVGGYWLGHQDYLLPLITSIEGAMLAPASTAAEPAGPVIYYRAPDSVPAYSAKPAKTADGKPYIPVYADDEKGADSTAEIALPLPATIAQPTTSPMEDKPSASGKTILYYRNPMGLPDTSPTPKKDSMGMDYLPVYAGEETDGSSVVVSPGKMQRTGVRSEPAGEHVMVRTVRVPATITVDERRLTVVATRSEAFVDKVAEVTTGDRIAKGQPLLWLYSADIATASAQYLTDLTVKGTLSTGARQRLQNLGVPADVIAGIEASRTVPVSIAWSSPRDGVIVERNVTEGMKASPGDMLFKIADLSSIWVVADVAEYDLASVKPGDEVALTVRSLPDRAFKGQIGLIYPGVSQDTRTTKVRIEISNPDGSLLPGMYADVDIATGSSEPVLAVPDSAVIDTGLQQVVIIDRGKGRFEPKIVRIGRRGDGYAEILEGISKGDQVVVAANFLIDAESNLKAALSGMSSSGEVTP